MPACGRPRDRALVTPTGRPHSPARSGRSTVARVADLEYRAWVSYYKHNWHQASMAFIRLIRMGFGMDWYRTLHAACLPDSPLLPLVRAALVRGYAALLAAAPLNCINLSRQAHSPAPDCCGV